MANALGMLCLQQREGHRGHNVTKLHVSRKATSQFLSYVSVSHTQTIFQTPIYVFIFLLVPKISVHILLLWRFHDRRCYGDDRWFGGDSAPLIQAEEEGRRGMVESSDLEGNEFMEKE